MNTHDIMRIEKEGQDVNVKVKVLFDQDEIDHIIEKKISNLDYTSEEKVKDFFDDIIFSNSDIKNQVNVLRIILSSYLFGISDDLKLEDEIENIDVSVEDKEYEILNGSQVMFYHLEDYRTIIALRNFLNKVFDNANS